MANKKKIAVLCGCAVLFIAAGVIVAVTRPETEEGAKSFTLEVYSERDGIDRSTEYESDYEYFGQWCREQDFITWQDSDYGIYITAVDGCAEDMNEQYWWCIMENGESSSVGADELPLSDGSVYRLELKQGW